MTLQEIEASPAWLATFRDKFNNLAPILCLMQGERTGAFYWHLPNGVSAVLEEPLIESIPISIRAFDGAKVQTQIRIGRLLPVKIRQNVELDKILK